MGSRVWGLGFRVPGVAHLEGLADTGQGEDGPVQRVVEVVDVWIDLVLEVVDNPFEVWELTLEVESCGSVYDSGFRFQVSGLTSRM